MEAGADKPESKLAEGKHNLMKKFDQNFQSFQLKSKISEQREEIHLNFASRANINLRAAQY